MADCPPQAEAPPRFEPYIQPVNGIVQPPVVPPPSRPGRRTNVLEDLKSVLNFVWRSRWSHHFRHPVDAISLSIPDYHTIILHPMDLSTIKKRLNNNYYWQADEALEDFELMFENCMLYNLEGSPVYEAGKELRETYYTRIASIDMSHEEELKPKADKKKRKTIVQNNSSPVEQQKETITLSVSVSVKPPDAGRTHPKETPAISYEHLDYLIEKSHCEHLLESMLKRKYIKHTWPFNCVDLWRKYSKNTTYNHYQEEKLDWKILQHMLTNDLFDGIDSFANTVRRMFQNALRCFPDDALVKPSVKRTGEMFESRLRKYKDLIAEAKGRARAQVAKKLIGIENKKKSSVSEDAPIECTAENDSSTSFPKDENLLDLVECSENLPDGISDELNTSLNGLSFLDTEKPIETTGSM